MPVKKLPEKFVATDGTEFETRPDAELHDRIDQARQNFTIAHNQLARLLGEKYLTADGKPFRFGVCSTYYSIKGVGNGPPHVEEFAPGYRFEFVEGADDLHVTRYDEEQKRNVTVRVGAVYANRDEAERACIKKYEVWLADQTSWLAAHRKRLGVT